MVVSEKIKKIKYSRLSIEEKHLINVFDNMVEYKTSLYPDNIYYTLNGKIVLEINPDDKYFYILYDVWKGANKDKTIINTDTMILFSHLPGFGDTQHFVRCFTNNYLGLDNYYPKPVRDIRWKINNIVYNDGSIRED
jgi:uncharacterized Fe-S center protein